LGLVHPSKTGVIAAVQQANHFATANNNNNNGSSSKTRPSCVPVPYPAGVIYCEEDRDKERAELELLQKRYVELVDLVHRLAPNKKILPSEHGTQAITSKRWMRK